MLEWTGAWNFCYNLHVLILNEVRVEQDHAIMATPNHHLKEIRIFEIADDDEEEADIHDYHAIQRYSESGEYNRPWTSNTSDIYYADASRQSTEPAEAVHTAWPSIMQNRSANTPSPSRANQIPEECKGRNAERTDRQR